MWHVDQGYSDRTYHIIKLPFTFEGIILDQVVSCFSGKILPLVFLSVMYVYFKNKRGK